MVLLHIKAFHALIKIYVMNITIYYAWQFILSDVYHFDGNFNSSQCFYVYYEIVA